MAAPATVFRGAAAVSGIPGAFDAILYALQQTGKATQNFEEEIIKDVNGYDYAWLFRNEHVTFDCMLKLIGDTLAHAEAPAQAIAYSAGLAGSYISATGQPFLGPGSVITLSGFQLAALNGVFQVLSGGDADIANTKSGDLNLKLRRYANSNQQTGIATSPVTAGEP